MVSEQITESRYWPTSGEMERLVRVSVEVAESAEEDVDVDIVSTFESDQLGRWADVIYREVNNGVHEGIGAAGFALPKAGLLVRITGITVEPPVTNDTAEVDALTASATIRALVSATVNSQIHRMHEPVSRPD